jgi:hypothetical protein
VRAATVTLRNTQSLPVLCYPVCHL